MSVKEHKLTKEQLDTIQKDPSLALDIFIALHSVGEPTPTPTPEPTPQPTPVGSSTTKDGVVVPVKIKGAFDYTVREDWRDGGARFNMKAAGLQLVMVGYFTATKDGGDEVSAKVLGGRHTSSAKYQGCMYDLGAPVGGGTARMRCECPHPTYTSTLKGPQVIKAAAVDSIVGSYKGFMVIVTQEAGKVRLKWFQDVGPNDTKPANKWKSIYEYLDDGKNLDGIDSKFFPIKNLDHTEGTAQNTWRIDATPGLKQKWCAIAELA